MKGEEEEEEEEEEEDDDNNKGSEDLTEADIQAEEPQQSNESTDSTEGCSTGCQRQDPPLSQPPRGII